MLALIRRGAYSPFAMKEPSSNENQPTTLHEILVKAGIQAGIERSAGFVRRMKSGDIRIPKGVYRFKTHGEANEWWDKILSGSTKRFLIDE